MEITASYLNHNGSLVNVKDSNWARNKKQNIATHTKNYLIREQPMTKQIITGTNKQPKSKDLGRGSYMLIATQYILTVTKITTTPGIKTAQALLLFYKTS